jgi:hypothetical protein
MAVDRIGTVLALPGDVCLQLASGELLGSDHPITPFPGAISVTGDPGYYAYNAFRHRVIIRKAP